ncbi:hypothetical protein EVAR_15834_1 [Eumeta japonica]|uniref:Uncharacterized protein n=1 Tax=Eumeta variegata TaxID=151549 RepID=A0A4C1UE27_EUMVA|nr:hypothetical protein EVAR_15834_1 [Eumeta japonica]
MVVNNSNTHRTSDKGLPNRNRSIAEYTYGRSDSQVKLRSRVTPKSAVDRDENNLGSGSWWRKRRVKYGGSHSILVYAGEVADGS